MKKLTLVAIFMATISGAGASDYYETFVRDCNPAAMRAELDRAAAAHRSVITVVKCDADAVARDGSHRVTSDDDTDMNFERDVRVNCDGTIERVVARRHYVKETVVQYAPVVTYVPAGTYTRTRRVCHECDM